MTNQPWMLFKPEGAAVFYLWNGKFPVLIQNYEGNKEPWFWDGKVPGDMPAEEIKLLNEVATSKRKKVFTVPRKGKRRYTVIQRGVFEKEDV